MATLTLNDYNQNRYNLKLTKGLAKLLLSIGVVVCVEKYVNGNSGYRIYSDGYCEQWGMFNGKNVTLLIPHINTSYSITLGKRTTREQSSSVNNILSSKVTNKGFYATCNNNDTVVGNPVGYWVTRGYINYAL